MPTIEIKIKFCQIFSRPVSLFIIDTSARDDELFITSWCSDPLVLRAAQPHLLHPDGHHDASLHVLLCQDPHPAVRQVRPNILPEIRKKIIIVLNCTFIHYISLQVFDPCCVTVSGPLWRRCAGARCAPTPGIHSLYKQFNKKVYSQLFIFISVKFLSSTRFFSLFGGSFSRQWDRPPPTYDESLKHVNPDLQQRPPDPPPYSESFRARCGS